MRLSPPICQLPHLLVVGHVIWVVAVVTIFIILHFYTASINATAILSSSASTSSTSSRTALIIAAAATATASQSSRTSGDPSKHIIITNRTLLPVNFEAPPLEGKALQPVSATTRLPVARNLVRRQTTTDNSKKSIVVGYLTAALGNLNDRQGLSISGAVTMALHEINNSPDLLPDVELVLRWNDTRGDTVLSTKAITEMICDEVAVFFGPEGSCYVEAIVAQSRNIPMISYKCSDYKASEIPTFARTEPPDTQVTKSVVALLSYYKWSKFTIIYEEEFTTVAQSLKKEAFKKNMTVNHERIAKNRHRCCEEKLKCCGFSYWYNYVQETKNSTRIYVLFGEQESLLDLMNIMDTAQLFKNGEYIVIYVDTHIFSQKHSYVFKPQEMDEYKSCEEFKDYEAFLKRSRSLFVVTPTAPTQLYEKFTQTVLNYTSSPPFIFIKPSRFKNKLNKFVSFYAAYLYDAVKLYAHALHTLFEEHVTLTDEIIKTVVSNGTKIIETIIKRRSYTSVTGATMNLDSNGDSEGNYSVLAFQQTRGDGAVTDDFSCAHQMLPVGQFFYRGDTKFPEYKILTHTKIQWAGKVKPDDEPSCGFNNKLCPKRNTHMNGMIAAGILAVLLFCVSVVTMSIYRKWKIEQEIEGLLWKIDASEVHRHSYFERDIVSSSSRMSLGSVSVTSYESRGGLQVFATTAVYRNIVVRIKELNFSRKKDISREVMKEMRLLRELRHDNVNSFIGACVEPTSILLVTDYCAKGSLYDIIENEDMKLDTMFIASLVNDLIKGMLYLHQSVLMCHGNLKSSNCVVTSRWVLQVADFGLAELQHCAENDSIGDHQHYRGLFWKAPEILRHPHVHIRGTQMGDVYAFAIIMFELLGRRGPFGNNAGFEPKEIIELVKRIPAEGEEPFRPDTNLLLDSENGSVDDYIVQCVKDCWAELPDMRPDFPTIRRRLKRMKDGKHRNIMDQMMEMMVTYANNLEDLVNERTRLLYEEKLKTEDLLHRMLPKPVAQRLTKGYGIEPEFFDLVTIYFSDIVGFTALSAESTPLQVVDFLNELYTIFDRIIKGYEVYKVETIGDAYMVVSGLPIRNADRHAGEIASMALELLTAVKIHTISHRPNETLKLRIGIHTGPVVAGVVGLTMPRYCLFGDTVNTASRMESNGEPLKIHISLQCKQALDKLGGYIVEDRGLVHMKGKGEVRTYWLVGTTEKAVQKRHVDLDQLPPLFCRPGVAKWSPKLTSDSRHASICFSNSVAITRRHSNQPKDGSKLTLNSNSVLFDESILSPVLPPPQKRILSSIESSSMDDHRSSTSQTVVQNRSVRESKSLTSLHSVLSAPPVEPDDPDGGQRRFSAGETLQLMASRLLSSLSPRKSRSIHTSLHTVPEASSPFQIIAIPHDQVDDDDGTPHSNGAAPLERCAEDDDTNIQVPLLSVDGSDAQRNAPVIVRRRDCNHLEGTLPSSTSKRWKSLEMVQSEESVNCPSVPHSITVTNRRAPSRNVKNWLLGLFSGNSFKSGNGSLMIHSKNGDGGDGEDTSIVRGRYQSVQLTERESVV